MTDLELEEQRLLAAAREELAPDAGAMTRVRVATELALLAMPSAAGPSVEAGPVDVLWHAPGLATRLIAAALLGVSAGAIGYGLGTERSASSEATAPRMTLPVVVSVPVPETAPVADSAAGPAPVVAPAPVAAPAPAPVVAPAPPRARAQLDDAEASTADALQRELSGVKQVESELRAGNPSRALVLLRELDRSVPNGQLREERHAADAIARCALGLGDEPALGAAFAAEFPGSAYVARVRQRCDEGSR